ncbi:hypothetical protein B0T26DRAFT_848594, partial [Lasiosphaeria miniovina]
MAETAAQPLPRLLPATGMTVLFEPHEPHLDIVFIHGFTGHPERTWTSKKANAGRYGDSPAAGESSEPPSKYRRLNPFPASRHERGVYWPRDLVPITVPYARIFTYGYNTHIGYPGGPPMLSNTVSGIAQDFLVALESERRTESTRPLLFVAHSLGGIIVKKMLLLSRDCHQAHFGRILESTAGIIFFGTPHAGADPRGFRHHIAERLANVVGVSANEQIVQALLPSSEILKDLRDRFGPMAQGHNWIIHSFQEEVGIGLLSGQKVVHDTSSCLNIAAETVEHIGRDHMEMCRFPGLDDVEYKKVAAALRRIATTAPRQSTEGKTLILDESQKRTLLESLRFDQIDARQLTIKRAHIKTCTWLLQKSEYLDWLDPTKLGEHHGFLWIKGKPGAGKSTLMKFAVASARRKMKETTIISFFFNARGDELEKSTTGMYRSLLLQLLERYPALQDVFDTLGLVSWNGACLKWTVESLKALFEQAVLGLGKSPLACFIDALDECDEYQIRDMLSFFEHVGEMAVQAEIRFQVLFSSRYYPHISIAKGLEFALERQEEHVKDIIDYLDSELNIGHSKHAETIRHDLREKAAGVFMWVVLVVEILNKEYDGGRIHALQKRLRDIPRDLHELFREILTRDQHNKGELLLCIQWVLFARQPLKPEELYFAVLSGIEPGALFEWDPEEITEITVKKFILNSSKGLAEITKSKPPTVQFIHESVRDFLLKGDGLKGIWPEFKDFRGESHERLKQCCLAQINAKAITSLNLTNPLPKATSQEAVELRRSAARKFPFLEYTVRNVLFHADVAAGSGINQNEFLRDFQLPVWIDFDNLFEKHNIRRHTSNASLLYILAEHNIGNLITSYPSNLTYFEVGEERYGPPFFAAVATNSDEAVRALLMAQLGIQLPASLLHRTLESYCEDKDKWIKLGRDFIFHPRRGILSYIVEQGDEIL